MSFFPSREILLTVGPLSVHWYGVMYALGFLLGTWMLPRLARFRRIALTNRQTEVLFFALFLGVIVGGRLGFLLFYEPSFLLNPAQAIAVWEGGMSSHGGLIGIAIAMLWFCRRERVPFLSLVDVLVVPGAIGLALGRVGNFINLELYGTVTTLPWGIEIPGVEGLRHPTQIYAVIKDLTIALACFLHLRSRSSRPGRTTVLFLLLYGVFRFFVEHFRDQPYGLTDLGIISLSRGQLYTLPVIALGIVMLIFLKSRNVKDNGEMQ